MSLLEKPADCNSSVIRHAWASSFTRQKTDVLLIICLPFVFRLWIVSFGFQLVINASRPGDALRNIGDGFRLPFVFYRAAQGYFAVYRNDFDVLCRARKLVILGNDPADSSR